MHDKYVYIGQTWLVFKFSFIYVIFLIFAIMPLTSAMEVFFIPLNMW